MSPCRELSVRQSSPDKINLRDRQTTDFGPRLDCQKPQHSFKEGAGGGHMMMNDNVIVVQIRTQTSSPHILAYTLLNYRAVYELSCLSLWRQSTAVHSNMVRPYYSHRYGRTILIDTTAVVGTKFCDLRLLSDPSPCLLH